MLTAADLTYRYPHATRAALLDLSASWRPGEFCALVGPNGSGKTTLLGALSGELKPTAGRLQWDGQALERIGAEGLAQRRAHLSQSPRLDFAFTVKEVVGLGRSPFRDHADRVHDVERIAAALHEVDLETFTERSYLELSRGEKQRVHLARALAQLPAGEPEQSALFLDEPTNHLDLEHQYTTLELARRRAREGRLVITVLHDLNLALQYADRAIVLAEGKAVADGAPADVLTPRLLAEVFRVRASLVHLRDRQPFLAINAALPQSP